MGDHSVISGSHADCLNLHHRKNFESRFFCQFQVYCYNQYSVKKLNCHTVMWTCILKELEIKLIVLVNSYKAMHFLCLHPPSWHMKYSSIYWRWLIMQKNSETAQQMIVSKPKGNSAITFNDFFQGKEVTEVALTVPFICYLPLM